MRGGHTSCGGCGKPMQKAHANVDGVGYCGSCYKRDFKPVACSKCGKTTRSLHGATPVVCRSCRNEGKPCKRCGKIRPPGRVFEDGSIACVPCVRWFDEPQPCNYCGTLSVHLSRELASGVMEPACPKCLRKARQQCALCKKKQPLPYENADGLRVCKTCYESGKKYVCPQCGKEGTRKNDKQCFECHWLDNTIKKLETFANTLNHRWTKVHYVGLIHELIMEMNISYAYPRVGLYYKLFKKLDEHFEHHAMITTDEISEIFGKGKFVRHSRVIGYLIHKKVLPAAFIERLRESDSLLGQKNVINRAKDKWYERLMNNFFDALKKKHENYRNKGWEGEYSRFVMKTILSCLNTASSFLESLPDKVKSVPQIHQGHITDFLTEKPGNRNSLREFIKYLNRSEKKFQPLVIEQVKRTSLAAHLVLGQEKYISLLKAWLYPKDDESVKESVICLFMLLYLQRASDIVRLKLIDVIELDGYFGFPFGSTDLMLDAKISALVRRYLEQRETMSRYDDVHSNEYLFPGRHYKGHLSSPSVAEYLKKHKVSEAQLFSTGLVKIYQNGVDASKIVESMTGISGNTASRYYNILNPRLVDETNQYLDEHMGDNDDE